MRLGPRGAVPLGERCPGNWGLWFGLAVDATGLQKRFGDRIAVANVDLAVPRDIDPEVEKLEDVFLYNVDHLQTVADEYTRLRRDEVARCEEIIRIRVEAMSGGNGGRAEDGVGSALPIRPS